VYFGEYPLSFAACLGQEECVRLLLAKGANPNLQDTNGNTVMHMLVIHDKKVCYIVECGIKHHQTNINCNKKTLVLTNYIICFSINY
jgi:ankyrin repeat protein